MDMAIPRDVEFNTDYMDTIDVYDLDSVHKFVKTQQELRKGAIPEAEEIIERRLGEFIYWFSHLSRDSFYSGLNTSFESIRKQEIAPLLEKLPLELRAEVEAASLRLVDKLLQLNYDLAVSKKFKKRS